MYTIEQFQNLPQFSQGRVLTLEEVRNMSGPELISITEVGTGSSRPAARFYVTKHGYGHGIVPENFVSCSMTIPHRVVPREGFEEGWIYTAADQVRFEDYCDRTYGHPHTHIESLEQLVDYLNEHYGVPA